jgi:hypothetical protein
MNAKRLFLLCCIVTNIYGQWLIAQTFNTSDCNGPWQSIYGVVNAFCASCEDEDEPNTYCTYRILFIPLDNSYFSSIVCDETQMISYNCGKDSTCSSCVQVSVRKMGCYHFEPYASKYTCGSYPPIPAGTQVYEVYTDAECSKPYFKDAFVFGDCFNTECGKNADGGYERYYCQPKGTSI